MPSLRPATRIDDLLRRAQSGDDAARRAIVDKHGPRVWALCRRLDHDPEDAYQAVWERILGALHRFDPHRTGSFGGWVTTVTHRMLVDRHRRRRVRGDVFPIDELASPEPDPEVVAMRARRHDLLEGAIQQLPADQRRVVVLHHIHGLALDEISNTEGVPKGTLKSRLHRGRARLAQLLGAPDA